MENFEEQRTCIKFCFHLGKSATETYQMLKIAFLNDCVSRSTCFEWFSRFTNGIMITKDQHRPGRPVTQRTDENVMKIKSLIKNDGRITIRMIVEEMGISYGMCQKIITDETNPSKICTQDSNKPANRSSPGNLPNHVRNGW